MAKMIDNLEEDISEYERATGEKVTPRQKAVFSALLNVCDAITELGAQDAASNKPQRGKDVFAQRIQRGIPGAGECGPIIDLFYDCYTNGYSCPG